MNTCPHCHYVLITRSTYCPYCGIQLTHPGWKKAVAWIFLVLIGYVLVRCHWILIRGPLES